MKLLSPGPSTAASRLLVSTCTSPIGALTKRTAPSETGHFARRGEAVNVLIRRSEPPITPITRIISPCLRTPTPLSEYKGYRPSSLLLQGFLPTRRLSSCVPSGHQSPLRGFLRQYSFQSCT